MKDSWRIYKRRVRGTYLPAYVFAESDDIEDPREAEAAKQLGLPAEFTESTDTLFDLAGALRFDDQAQFHLGKYLLAVAETIDGDGLRVLGLARLISRIM